MQSTNTKERLLYRGIKLFSAKGYSNIGIRQLCTSVGIKESSFSNHFKSKESLFREIMGLMVREGEQCMACFHWCSQGAINWGVNTGNTIQYHHPQIALKDIIYEGDEK